MPVDDLLFWGKLGSLSGGSRTYHPLKHHLIDVAAVARQLWSNLVPPKRRAAVAAAFGIDESDTAIWVELAAGLHDLGKLSPAFQFKSLEWRDRLSQVGLRPPLLIDNIPHGTITAAEAPEILETEYGLAGPVARMLATAAGGHHGVFPSAREILRASRAAGSADWQAARRIMAVDVAAAIGAGGPRVPQQIDQDTAMWLAGFISIADWIGSDERFFPYSAVAGTDPNVSSKDYAAGAFQHASDAVNAIGFSSPPTPNAPEPFSRLFPAYPPRPLQSLTAAMAEERSGSQSLVIIEAPMGEGKTEAALYIIDRLSALGQQQGMYFALPTQATSNQMFDRVVEFLERRLGGDARVRLLHGHASLIAERTLAASNATVELNPTEVRDEGSETAAPLDASDWFSYRKRGLLTAFGVGTVDQILMAVLQTRHVFVRLFGLSGKTIVVDEVHAYDTYMGVLLDRLLEWLAVLGCSVILLSATLPRSRRENLIAAYGRGLGGTSSPGPPVPYPRVTWVDPSGARCRSIESVNRADVALRWLPANGHEGDLADFLDDKLRDGGCAVVICNTVRRAQEIYRSLKSSFPGIASDGKPELDLFHARFRFLERQERERRVLNRFSKPDVLGGASAGRPRRAVLVATQVIEQSLDVDFDFMVSDLAPADLLLQRMGRLHRHRRTDRRGPNSPELCVIAPRIGDDGAPEFAPGDTAVYDAHILLRTWLRMRGLERIRIPDDVETLVEAVYDDDRPCADQSPSVRARWDQTWLTLSKARADQEAKAKWNRILPPHYDGDLLGDFNLQLHEDDPEIHQTLQALTRLTEPSITVVLLRPDEAGLLDAGTSPSAARELLARSVSLSDKRIYRHLVNDAPPAGWERSSLLRHCRLCLLDDDGRISVGNYDLRLDEEVGIVVEDR